MNLRLYIVSKTWEMFQSVYKWLWSPMVWENTYMWKMEHSLKRQLNIMQYITFPNANKRVRERGWQKCNLLGCFITNATRLVCSASVPSSSALIYRIVTKPRRRESELKVTYTSVIIQYFWYVKHENGVRYPCHFCEEEEELGQRLHGP